MVPFQVHTEAICMALRDGVSRHGPNHGGLGFRQVFKSLASFWGHLRFRSGEGRVTVLGEDCGPDRGEIGYPPSLPGFQVTVCCRTREPDPLSKRPFRLKIFSVTPLALKIHDEYNSH
jgi:hypothetical protein